MAMSTPIKKGTPTGHACRAVLSSARRNEIWDHVYRVAMQPSTAGKWCTREELVEVTMSQTSLKCTAHELTEVMRGKKHKLALGVESMKVDGEYLHRFMMPGTAKALEPETPSFSSLEEERDSPASPMLKGNAGTPETTFTPSSSTKGRATARSSAITKAPQTPSKSRSVGSSSRSKGTPTSSSKSKGTPTSSSRSKGTPTSSSKSKGTPTSSSRTKGTPTSSSRSKGTPTTPKPKATRTVSKSRDVRGGDTGDVAERTTPSRPRVKGSRIAKTPNAQSSTRKRRRGVGRFDGEQTPTLLKPAISKRPRVMNETKTVTFSDSIIDGEGINQDAGDMEGADGAGADAGAGAGARARAKVAAPGSWCAIS